MWVSGGKNRSFLGKFDVLCILVYLRFEFVLLPYYRRIRYLVIGSLDVTLDTSVSKKFDNSMVPCSRFMIDQELPLSQEDSNCEFLA